MQAGLFAVGEWVLIQRALSPKQGDTRLHTLYWHGPANPAYWSQDPQKAHVFPSPEAAHEAWTAHVEQAGHPRPNGEDVHAAVLPRPDPPIPTDHEGMHDVHRAVLTFEGAFAPDDAAEALVSEGQQELLLHLQEGQGEMK